MGPGVAAGLLVVFLATLATGQLLQRFGPRDATGEAGPSRVSVVFSAVCEAFAARPVGGEATSGAFVARVVAANRALLAELRAIDDALDHDSAVGRVLRPWTQLALIRWLGAGNEQAYRGRGGWLFYRPDVESLTGPGFLDPAQRRRRAASGGEWAAAPEPDPRPAVAQFARQLRDRGIALVVVPVPVKPAIHPERLSRTYPPSSAPIRNPSMAAVLEAFTAAGAIVFDATDTLQADRDRHNRPPYLATDTHWRPDAMEAVAGRLASFIHQRVALPERPDPGYRVEQHAVRAFGDIRVMLDLPAGARLYPEESVTVRRVLGPDDRRWRPSRTADVLVLGDSYSNVYSLASMGWGEASGFVEHLSLALKRPVDRIVENDDGAFATRNRLHLELAGGVDRLAGKRVVVYEFSARELALGDWRVFGEPDDPIR